MFDNFDLSSYLIGLFVLFLSISVHEWAHAYFAYKMGDETALRAGRVTLNPMKHFEPIGLMLILFGAPVAWGKPVPVNSNNFRRDVNRKNAMLWVSLSGITFNLILAVVSAALFYTLVLLYNLLLFNSVEISTFATTVLQTLQQINYSLIFLNVNLAVFNLLPIPPLDGFELANRFLPDKWSYFINRNSRSIGFVLLMVIVFFNRPFSFFLGKIITPIVSLIQWPFKELTTWILKLIVG